MKMHLLINSERKESVCFVKSKRISICIILYFEYVRFVNNRGFQL